MSQQIAFIGLGNMGAPMALNLLKHGHKVRVFDLNQQAIDQITSHGGEGAESAVEAAADADVVISMLPNGAIVKSLYLGSQGLVNFLKPGTLVIDSSTIAADDAREVARECLSHELAMIDAPVSGGTAVAQAGNLTFICGGSKDHFELARPVLEAMGKNIFHAGDSGAGQVAKICNNMLLAIHMIGTSEALSLGASQGLDPGVLSEIMKASSGNNWSLQIYNPYPGVMDSVPASNHYRGGFMVDLMNKDLGLAQALASKSASSTPLGALATQLYQIHKIKGNGSLDFSSIINLFKKN